MPSSGGDLSLATLWAPVQPSTEGLGEAMRAAGEKGRREFESGFKGSGSSDPLLRSHAERPGVVEWSPPRISALQF